MSAMDALIFIRDIVIGYYLADFLTGLGHWVEDTYFDENTRYVGSLAIDNVIHHKDPRRMVQYNFIETISTTVMVMTPIYFVLLLAFGNSTVVHSLMFFTMIVNQIHKWSHMSVVPPIVRWLQLHNIIINPQNHRAHHTNGFRTNYCIIHEQLNWLYDSIGLWDMMESGLGVFGIYPKQR